MRHLLVTLSLTFAACTTQEAPRVVTQPSQDDPRTAVTSWSQVERFNCARGADGAPGHCAADADCHDGNVCDTSTGCGCCVPPPPRVEPDATVRRYMFTGCNAGHCAPPRFCEPAADGTSCTMRFDRELPLWVSTYVPPQGADALAATRRALCIKVEPNQECMWSFEIPGGQYTADTPVPTRYEGSYECGGRTCNGEVAMRASPRVGSSFTARLVVNHCGE